MTTGELIALVGAWVVVGLGPGLLLALGLRPGAGWFRAVSLAPLLSMGLLLPIALVFDAVGGAVGSVTPVGVLVTAYVIGIVALVVRRRLDVLASPLRLGALELIPLAVAVLVAAGIWWWASQGLTLVPPNDDGSNHGLFTTQILGLHTVQPDRVVVGDVISGQPSSPYYPLAMHVVAAVIAGIAHVPVAPALLIQVVLIAGAALPAGMLVLTRRLYPSVPAAAGVAAVFVVMLAAFPYYIASWGGLPFILGMALLPVAVDTVAGASQEARPIAAAALVGLCWVGLFGVHSSEMVMAGALAALLVIGALLRRERRLRDEVWPWLGGFVLLVVFVAPQVSQLRAGAGNVAVAALIPKQTWQDSVLNAITYITGTPNPALTPDLPAWLHVAHVLSGAALWVLAVVGVVISVRRGWSPEWAVALVAVVLLTVASSMRLPLIDSLTVPWYSRWDRLVMNELVLLAPLAAVGVVIAMKSRVAAAWVVAAVVAAPSMAVSAVVAHSAFADNSLADPSTRAAYRWLSAHVARGDRVLNDPTDGSGWMWALNEVAPLFAVAPHQIEGWGDRLTLQRRAADIASDSRIAAIADQWKVRYAYVGPRVYLQQEPDLSVRELVAGGGWRVVFESGGATVLERAR